MYMVCIYNILKNHPIKTAWPPPTTSFSQRQGTKIQFAEPFATKQRRSQQTSSPVTSNKATETFLSKGDTRIESLIVIDNPCGLIH